MSPPLLGVGEEESGSSVTLLASSASLDSIAQNGLDVKECNYMGSSNCSSVGSSAISTTSEDNKSTLNLRATELRLGLPGSQSPGRESELCLHNSTKLDEKPLFPLHPMKDDDFSSSQRSHVLGNKRGFSDAMDEFSEEKSRSNSDVNAMLSPKSSVNLGVKPTSQTVIMKELVPVKAAQERSHVTNENGSNRTASATNHSSPPATKAQVVGWPPIRSFRKNTLTTTSKNSNEANGKARPGGAFFIKVSMDGAPYLRKVDLRTYSTYQELSSALEKMFSCFTIGQCGPHGTPGREVLSESKLKDILHGSEYVLTYEDKDGDWMLVGDVPWEMFINTCKRLRIMKSSDAIGLAPRAMEKCRNRN